ncbi:MAG: hypothetical protein GF308_04170 [Candidatus Heimdallarchaeota archaeon]|nr:hypothetical protein [Candidatus Heimdallarchaeota archaeon]
MNYVNKIETELILALRGGLKAWRVPLPDASSYKALPLASSNLAFPIKLFSL